MDRHHRAEPPKLKGIWGILDGNEWDQLGVGFIEASKPVFKKRLTVFPSFSNDASQMLRHGFQSFMVWLSVSERPQGKGIFRLILGLWGDQQALVRLAAPSPYTASCLPNKNRCHDDVLPERTYDRHCTKLPFPPECSSRSRKKCWDTLNQKDRILVCNDDVHRGMNIWGIISMLLNHCNSPYKPGQPATVYSGRTGLSRSDRGCSQLCLR